MQNRISKVRKTHSIGSLLNLDNASYAKEVLRYTLENVILDNGKAGDVTTNAIFSKNTKVHAVLKAKASGILAGMQELEYFLKMSWGIKVKSPFGFIKLKSFKKDGDILKKDEIIGTLEGNLQDILVVERTILNLIQRMSGIATLTSEYVKKVPENVLIVPTRKTLWGLLDKRACFVGGAGTHRLNLSDAILLKDTHLDLMNRDLKLVFDQVFSKKNFSKLKSVKFVEFEVENSDEALMLAEIHRKYIDNGGMKIPFYIMLDNMKSTEIKSTIKKIKKHYANVFFEASGGINLKNIKSYANSGVDVISVGTLTHSAKALDISLKID